MSQMDNPQQQGTGEGLREKGEQIRSAAQKQAEQLRQNAGEYYEQGRQMAGEYYEQGRQKAMEWSEELEHYVREQPMKSVLIAAGVGMVLGFLWRRS
jgi:ElaB/YqjD/DUF883 family membrane-anchored ribosome-binding protein